MWNHDSWLIVKITCLNICSALHIQFSKALLKKFQMSIYPSTFLLVILYVLFYFPIDFLSTKNGSVHSSSDGWQPIDNDSHLKISKYFKFKTKMFHSFGSFYFTGWLRTWPCKLICYWLMSEKPLHYNDERRYFIIVNRPK